MIRGKSAKAGRELKGQSQSTINLSDLKKKTQNLPSLRHSLTKAGGMSITRSGASQGKLRLGVINKATMVLSKQERNNPWARKTSIDEQTLVKRGLMQLSDMGVIPKTMDCLQLLNYKQEFAKMPAEEVRPDTKEQEAFFTNPAITFNSFPAEQQRQEKSREQQYDPSSKSPSRASKKTVIRSQTGKYEHVQPQTFRLSYINGQLQKNREYGEYQKRMLGQGMQNIFKHYLSRLEAFLEKHKLKKVTIIPTINQTKKLTDNDILHSIVNHKVLGIDLRVKGGPLQIFKNLVLMKVATIRKRRFKEAMQRIERVKNQFKITQFFREMIQKRWQYVTFKLGSFAEEQRKLMEESASEAPEVEIHVLAGSGKPQQVATWYKWQQRLQAQLTRLCGNQCDHLILLTPYDWDLEWWLEWISEMPSNWKQPTIHIFSCSLSHSNMPEIGNLYCGLSHDIVDSIRNICRNRRSVLVPYAIDYYLPKICETLGVKLLAGTYTPDSQKILFDEDESSVQTGGKFTKIQSSSQELTRRFSSKINSLTLSNTLVLSKISNRQLFIRLGIPVPAGLISTDFNLHDFYEKFTRLMLSQKSCSRWILKLPHSSFSRGVAVLETDSLKIIKEAKKPAEVRQEHVTQITGLLQSILEQKIAVAHRSLLSTQQFMEEGRDKGMIVESCLDSAVCVVVFGRVEPNGVFTRLGSYRKVVTQLVCLGAVYPAPDLPDSAYDDISRVTQHLYKSGIFGYISLELIFEEKVQKYYFTDIVPNMETYSSLSPLYKRLLDLSELDASHLQLKHSIFYCPFIDNNATKCETWHQFDAKFAAHKLKYIPGTGGIQWLRMAESPHGLAMLCIGGSLGQVLKMGLEGLLWLVSVGGDFNNFDKRFKSGQSDGLYIMDMIWRLRQLKKLN